MDSVQEKKQFDNQSQQDYLLVTQVSEIYDLKFIVEKLQSSGDDSWSRERLKKLLKGDEAVHLSALEAGNLKELLPKPFHPKGHDFRFIDLFAGIGGIRRGFEEIGGTCVFTSEWNQYSVRTYKANHFNDISEHVFNEDIREVTLSDKLEVNDEDAYSHINEHIPDHDVLLAGFPCQPFSLAGVSKKNSLGRKHGFECDTQGTLFFDVARILKAKRPAAFLLENVKNLKSHDKGKTFKVILDTLDELDYEVADVSFNGTNDPKVIDARHFVPQHRERIVLVGFRRDLEAHSGFTLKDIERPANVPTFGDILEPKEEVDKKYILTPNLWRYLFDYAAKHKEKGNGFGFGLTGKNDVARTLSARYHKDGSEILVDRGWDMAAGFEDEGNQDNRPRRLTPKECARLMGFDLPDQSNFKIPVSDTQAYRQFGNSVAVPVFRAVAKLMRPHILQAIRKRDKKDSKAA